MHSGHVTSDTPVGCLTVEPLSPSLLPPTSISCQSVESDVNECSWVNCEALNQNIYLPDVTITTAVTRRRISSFELSKTITVILLSQSSPAEGAVNV